MKVLRRGRNSTQHPGQENQDSQHMPNQPKGVFPFFADFDSRAAGFFARILLPEFFSSFVGPDVMQSGFGVNFLVWSGEF